MHSTLSFGEARSKGPGVGQRHIQCAQFNGCRKYLLYMSLGGAARPCHLDQVVARVDIPTGVQRIGVKV